MAAKVHQAVMKGVQAWAQQAIPQYFAHHQTVTKANEEAKTQFYGRWPELKGHEKQVLEIGRMFRQMNPQATPEDALEKVGQIVCAALGIQPGKGTATPSPTPAPTPARSNGGFRPAAAGGSQAGNAPPADNPFVQMANELLEDDEGG